MLKSELMELRKMYQDELDRRNELLKLLQTEEVKAYLKLSGEQTPSVKEIDIYKIIKEYLKKYKIQQTNDIYICTNAVYYYTECSWGERTTRITINPNIDSKETLDRKYKNIENGTTISATTDKRRVNLYASCLCSDFKQQHIVLNPYNTCENENGYAELRNMFFANAIKYGEPESLKLLLQKYPRTYPSKNV